jgi:hypothetical protein
MTGPDRDQLILGSIARYGLATAEAIHRMHFEGLGAKATERVLTRLLRQGKIVSYPLYAKTVYYTLTPSSARDLGLDMRRAGRPFGAQSLIHRFSTLLYCAAGPVRRVLLTGAEFGARFPHLRPTEVELAEGRGRGLSTNRYYIDAGDAPGHGGKARLALLVADFRSHQRRLVRKCRREVGKRESIGSFRVLMQGDLFMVTLLTPFPEKAAILAAALSRESSRARVEVVPGFAQLLTTGGTR